MVPFSSILSELQTRVLLGPCVTLTELQTCKGPFPETERGRGEREGERDREGRESHAAHIGYSLVKSLIDELLK